LLPQTLRLSSPSGNSKVPILRAANNLRLRRVDVLLVGSSPAILCSLRIGADLSASGAEVLSGGIAASNTTTGQTVTSFDVDTLPAESWLWLETSAASGSIESLLLAVYLEPGAA
jgi:phage baseplate assembly protein gpV